MSNIYSGMTSAQKDNERKYLNNLVSGGGGNAEWAKSQLKQLDSAGSSNTTTTSKTTTTTTKSSDPDAGLSIEAYKAKYGVSGASSNDTYKPNYGQVSTEKIEQNPYEELYKESQDRLKEMEAQIREQNRLAVEQGTNRLEAQKTNINQAADENARQAYVQYMQSQKALPQQLASQGVSGGATETANLGLQTAYQNNVNTINQNKANRLQEIDNAIVDLKNTGDLAMVEQVLANNQAALDAYTSTFDKGVGYNQWANQYNANRADTNREYEAQQMQAYLDAINEQNKLLSDEKKEERDNILKLYTGGYMSRDEAAARLGYDPAILYDTMGYLSQENALALKDKQMDINNTQSQISNRNTQTENTKTENARKNYDSVYKTAEKMWNDQAVTAENLSIWLANQDITDAEYDEILTVLGAKAVLDNLDKAGKLSI